MGDSVAELLQFVHLGARLDLKSVALGHILGLTGNADGIATLINTPSLLVSLITLLSDNNATIVKDSALCLVNVSADHKGALALLDLDTSVGCPPLQSPPSDITSTVVKFVTDPMSKIADFSCMILSNLSRANHDKVIDALEKSASLDDLIDIFTKKQYNKAGANLHYLSPLFSNLSQSGRVRRRFLDRIHKLVPFIEFEESAVRRGGVVGALRNCTFDPECHELLLGPHVDILPRLLRPLAGNEEFDDEDNDKLPLELQYLPEEKQREEDPDIRCMLLEALTQLCAKRKNREFIRERNTYVILRELHKWEKDRKVLLACENLVDILIRTEEEIGEDDLKTLKVPQSLSEDFNKADEQFLKDE
ncbi:protein HGH1 homolog [Tribolium castaneum]|uniref:Protein HGH1 homolog n=1 Tax=Tribolium castaneum TaxID=7070 RepID=D2A4N7_TRICA|nr:PREDICTED: protein HGH1 homolog [Tribolium castaneum]EFA05199.1 FAM203 family protein CG6073-like Protein [Tribolium castaneum]|eukprot:XP_971097.1 PREDICTED: protein HGH1 homolog [Tribolium castaneum]